MRSKYNLAIEVTADTSQADRKISRSGEKAKSAFGGSKGSGILESVGSTVGTLSQGLGVATGMATRIAGVFSQIVGTVGSIGGIIFGVFSTALSMAGQLVSTLASIPGILAKGGLAIAGSIAAASYSAHKAMGPAAEMEQYRTQLNVMGKGNLYDFLTKASAGKPFQMGETVQAGILMEAFKIGSKDFLADIMDAAAAFKKPLEEIVRIVGYAKSGRSGEALEAATRIGITRDDLRELGFKFEKSGELKGTGKDDLYMGLIQIMRNRFGGMAEQVGTKTYSGAFSDLKDAIFRAFADGFAAFLPTGTAILRGLGDIVKTTGEWFQSLDLEGVGQSLLKYFNDVKTVAESIFSAEGRDTIKQSLLDGWEIILTTAPLLFQALISDLANLFDLAVTSLEKVLLSDDAIIKTGKGIIAAFEQAGKSLYFFIADAMLLGARSFATTILGTLAQIKIPGLSLFAKGSELANIAAGPGGLRKYEAVDDWLKTTKLGPMKWPESSTSYEQGLDKAFSDMAGKQIAGGDTGIMGSTSTAFSSASAKLAETFREMIEVLREQEKNRQKDRQEERVEQEEAKTLAILDKAANEGTRDTLRQMYDTILGQLNFQEVTQ